MRCCVRVFTILTALHTCTAIVLCHTEMCVCVVWWIFVPFLFFLLLLVNLNTKCTKSHLRRPNPINNSTFPLRTTWNVHRARAHPVDYVCGRLACVCHARIEKKEKKKELHPPALRDILEMRGEMGDAPHTASSSISSRYLHEPLLFIYNKISKIYKQQQKLCALSSLFYRTAIASMKRTHTPTRTFPCLNIAMRWPSFFFCVCYIRVCDCHNFMGVCAM